MKIPIDFVAGTHGNFLEVCLNHASGSSVVNFNPFGTLGTSHQKSKEYSSKKLFHAEHWFELYVKELSQFDKIISINFSQDDLLLVSSLSLLRAGDFGIDNNQLSVDTVKKLNNKFYSLLLEEIYTSYPFLNRNDSSIPRHILREFFKFSFKNPTMNGYWLKQKSMQYSANAKVFTWDLKNFYSWEFFKKSIDDLSLFFNLPMDTSLLKQLHEQFLSSIPYLHDKTICDAIVNDVINKEFREIPDLSLFQESYINGVLENIFEVEMPFEQEYYFKSTKDVVYYIKN